MRARITKRIVDAAQSGRIYDTELRGFALNITPAGSKSYVVEYRAGRVRGAPNRRITIGKHGSPWTPDTARSRAKVILGDVARWIDGGCDGPDPAEARQQDRHGTTFGALIDLYFAEGVSHKKPLTVETDRGRAENHLRPLLGRLRIDRIGRADIERMRDAVTGGKTAKKNENGDKRPSGNIAKGGKGVAAQCVTLVSAIFAFAIGRRIICANNPARGVKKAPVRKVERFLSEAEIARLAEALDAAGAAYRQPLPDRRDQAAAADRLPPWRDRRSEMAAR